MNDETNQGESRPLREALLAQQSFPADCLAQYRQETQQMLEQNEQSLKREKRFVGFMWIYLVLLCTGFMLIGGYRPNTTLGVWFGVMACFWLLFGAVFLLKHFINRARVETLKEIKGVELQVMELKEALRKP